MSEYEDGESNAHADWFMALFELEHLPINFEHGNPQKSIRDIKKFYEGLLTECHDYMCGSECGCLCCGSTRNNWDGIIHKDDCFLVKIRKVINV